MMSNLSTWDESPPVKVDVHVELDLIDLDGNRERLALHVVADAAADFDAGLLGIGTPLGKAIAGRRAGSTAPYVRGDLRSVSIVSVRPAAAPAPDSLADSLAAQLEIERSRNAELMEALAAERDRAARAEAEAKAQLAEANARVAELDGKLASLAERQQAIAATPWWRRGRMAMKLLGPGRQE